MQLQTHSLHPSLDSILVPGCKTHLAKLCLRFQEIALVCLHEQCLVTGMCEACLCNPGRSGAGACPGSLFWQTTPCRGAGPACLQPLVLLITCLAQDRAKHGRCASICLCEWVSLACRLGWSGPVGPHVRLAS